MVHHAHPSFDSISTVQIIRGKLIAFQSLPSEITNFSLVDCCIRRHQGRSKDSHPGAWEPSLRKDSINYEVLFEMNESILLVLLTTTTDMEA